MCSLSISKSKNLIHKDLIVLKGYGNPKKGDADCRDGSEEAHLSTDRKVGGCSPQPVELGTGKEESDHLYAVRE